MTAMIEPTPNEEVVYNIIDIENELKKIARTGKPAKTGDYRTGGKGWSVEFENFYRKSDQLREVAKKHSWTRAVISAIARATVGAGFSFSRHPVFGRNKGFTAEEIDTVLDPIYEFFYGVTDDTRYIQDMTPLSSKIYYMVLSLVYYGQCALEIIRDENGQAISFDVLAGIVRPNISNKGKFLRPAYFFRPWNSSEIIAYRKPSDLVYITWPGIDMSIYGSTEFDALVDISIPSDLYASTAYRNHFENSNAPYNGFWVVDKNTSEEDFKRFLVTLVNRYSGVHNFGRTPIVIRGNAEFKETRSRSNDDAPYLEGRKYNMEEISAVSGVPSAKLGIAANATKTNFREQRRDFHENTLRPIFEIIEQAIYQQIIVREFGIKEWMLSFNNPDLTTKLEAATINTRYIQNGVLTPNEVRDILGYTPRDDEGGAQYYRPSNTEISDGINDERQSQPDGASMRQFDNERVPTVNRPEITQRDENKDFDIDEIVDELKTWKTFAIRIAKGKRNDRVFTCRTIPKEIGKTIQDKLDEVNTNEEAVRDLFDAVIATIDSENLEM